MRWPASFVAAAAVSCLAASALAAQAGSAFPLVTSLDVNGAVTDLCFAPAGDRLVVSGQAITVFDAASWRPVRSFPSGGTDLAISPDGSLLAMRGTVLEIAGGRTVWSGSAGLPLFSADGTLLVVGSDPIEVWDVTAWKQEITLDSPTPLRPVALALDPRGGVLYAVAFGSERLVADAWSVDTGAPLSPMAFSIWDRAGMSSSSLFADGQGLAVSAWNLDSAELRASLPTLLGPLSKAVAGLADVHLIAPGSFAAAALASTVHLISVANGTVIAGLSGDPAGVTALAASSDGTRLAAGGRSGEVDVWDISALLPYSCSGFSISRVDWQKGCVTLRNTTHASLDLLGWTISDGDNAFTFPASISVEAGRTYTVCPRLYNPGSSDRGLRIDATDEAVMLFCPELCGAIKADSVKR